MIRTLPYVQLGRLSEDGGQLQLLAQRELACRFVLVLVDGREAYEMLRLLVIGVALPSADDCTALLCDVLLPAVAAAPTASAGERGATAGVLVLFSKAVWRANAPQSAVATLEIHVHTAERLQSGVEMEAS